jgi:hypothetical protein
MPGISDVRLPRAGPNIPFEIEHTPSPSMDDGDWQEPVAVVGWSKRSLLTMLIRLPENVERSIVEAVRSGRFPSVDDAVTAAWIAFDDPSKPANARRPITPDDLHRQMLEDGLLTQLPNAAEDVDDDDEPIAIEGEPLSETIIRERR